MRYLTASVPRRSPNASWMQPPNVWRADTTTRSPQQIRSREASPTPLYHAFVKRQKLWIGTFSLLTSGTLYGLGLPSSVYFTKLWTLTGSGDLAWMPLP